MRLLKLSEFGTVVMGMSPSGETYNEKGEGLPLLNGPTEFTNTCPIPKLYTIDSKRECKEGDLIFCVRGSTTGKMNWSDQIYSIGRGVCAIRGNNLIDTKYIRYCIEHNLQGLLSVAGGGTFPNLKKDDIGNFEIPIVDNRKKIVEILSAYDDLIENNLKRIKLLEETAQNIYKEWFVNFRFPNFENTPINQETGLPEGWEIRKVTDFFDFTKGIEVGSANYEKEPNNEVVPFLRVGDISKRDGGIYVKKSLVKDKFVDRNDILISFDGSIGSVGYGLQGSYSSGLRKIVSKTELFGNGFMYCLVMSDNIQTTINAHAKGTTILHAGTSIIHLEFALSTDDVVSSFNQIANAIFEQLVSLNYQNQKLKEARDILLPRLMNRTIEV